MRKLEVTKKSVTPSVSNRMAIGAIIPTISIQDITSHVSGLGIYISSYFMRTDEPQVHSLNRTWHYPTNGNVDGNFWVYYQNVHGIPKEDNLLAQDLDTLAEYHIGCFCLLETNLDWNQPYIHSDFLARQQKTWLHAITSFLSIEMESPSDYMIGGRSLRVSEKNTDPWGMGHSSYQTLIGKRNSKVTIITWYRCIRNSSADASVWTQEKIFMQDQQSKQVGTNESSQAVY